MLSVCKSYECSAGCGDDHGEVGPIGPTVQLVPEVQPVPQAQQVQPVPGDIMQTICDGNLLPALPLPTIKVQILANIK